MTDDRKFTLIRSTPKYEVLTYFGGAKEKRIRVCGQCGAHVRRTYVFCPTCGVHISWQSLRFADRGMAKEDEE